MFRAVSVQKPFNVSAAIDARIWHRRNLKTFKSLQQYKLVAINIHFHSKRMHTNQDENIDFRSRRRRKTIGCGVTFIARFNETCAKHNYRWINISKHFASFLAGQAFSWFVSVFIGVQIYHRMKRKKMRTQHVSQLTRHLRLSTERRRPINANRTIGKKKRNERDLTCRIWTLANVIILVFLPGWKLETKMKLTFIFITMAKICLGIICRPLYILLIIEFIDVSGFVVRFIQYARCMCRPDSLRSIHSDWDDWNDWYSSNNSPCRRIGKAKRVSVEWFSQWQRQQQQLNSKLSVKEMIWYEPWDEMGAWSYQKKKKKK